jgi:ABC-type sugar transport system substrate-binding protein
MASSKLTDEHASQTDVSRRRFLEGAGALGLAGGTLAALTGCGSSSSASASAGKAGGPGAGPIQSWISSFYKKPVKIATTCFNTANPYFVPTQKAAQDAGAQLGITSLWTGVSANGSTAEHISQFNTLVSQGYQAIVVIPGEAAAWVEPINRAVSRGVLVLTTNSDSPNSDRELFFGQDLYQGAVLQAKKIIELLGGHGTVALTNCAPGEEALNQRVAGAHAGYSGSGVSVVGTYVTNAADPGSERTTIGNILTAHPNLSAIQCLCGPDTAFAGDVKKAKGGNFHIVGDDMIYQTLEYIKGGVIDATFGQNPYIQGLAPVLYAYMRVVMNMPKQPLPKDFWNSGTEVVERSNVDYYLAREKRWTSA